MNLRVEGRREEKGGVQGARILEKVTGRMCSVEELVGTSRNTASSKQE